MVNIIACNLGSYGRYRAVAYEHLRAIGLTNVEIPVPAPDALQGVLDDLDRYGLKVTSVLGKCDLSNPACVEGLKPQAEAATRLGAKIVFLSVKTNGIPLSEAYERLRGVGEVMAAAGLTAALETHPDLIQNASVALETMRAVDHPCVRVNFDTANIYYYNEGCTAVEELRKIAPYVVSVHLKDTNGGYRAHHFPTLGQGVVDYPEVFRILNGQGMYGPFTLELEGIAGEQLSEEQQKARVADSFAYLKQIGAA
ncbi:MAG TPA: sugar phosphate isomerase/epimerase family protein [Armatimonadota bacterium]|nr:sugar phosphate isomerase/epimerase family protein [Armatimonadota bacterium]HOM80734.1 sugar phosphate isomerase/epimerase family protein [Armatimonadota bacterium]HPO73810.1 sugar phosphate isomerase/epimerase family protein [Armatimonadota bacterium]